jgi:acylphosphatase
MVVLAIFIVPLYYNFKEQEPYFQLFMVADKLNLGHVLKFKEEAGQFVVAGYVPNHPATSYKIVLNGNESMKLERSVKMLAFVECGEGDPEMTTLIGDNLEDFIKFMRDKLLFPLHNGICKVAGLLSLGV